MVDLAKEKRTRRTSPTAKANRIAALAKGREKRKEMIAQRQVIRDKVKQGLPITEEERALAFKRFNEGEPNIFQLAPAAAELVIKPATVNALRLVVEKTAAKHLYNPVEALILLSRSPDIKDSDKVGIHKALMPFLVPVLSPVKEEAEVIPEDQRPKIVIKNFVLETQDARPIHESKRDSLKGPEIMVEAESTTPPTDDQS